MAVSVLVGPITAPGDEFPLAEAVGFRDGIAPVFLADAEVVGRLETPKLVISADLSRRLAVGQISNGHLGGFFGNRAGGNADHGASKSMLMLADAEPPVTV